jgi:rod shape-determining protein MreD
LVGGALLVLAAVERAVLSLVAVGGIRPDPLLVLTAVLGFARGPGIGSGFGLVSGLARDALAGRYVGLTALSRGLIGLGAGFLHRGFHTDNPLVPPLAAFGGTIAVDAVFLITLGPPTDLAALSAVLRGTMLPAASYNALLAPFFFLFHRAAVRRWQEVSGGPRTRLEVG